ncbi:MAG: hypothetical protein M3O64_02370 [Chloroflexota bacterium]|nr:hypothetical protein [Chloroflexota bacterium]
MAKNFARIFFRNCINLGVPAVESADALTLTRDGDEVSLDMAAAVLRTPRGAATIRPLAPFAQQTCPPVASSTTSPRMETSRRSTDGALLAQRQPGERR